MTLISIFAVLAAIAATVLLCLKVLPAKFDGKFSKKLFQAIHNYFNFKELYLERILKILFTFLTIACILVGVLTATLGNGIQFIQNIINAIEYNYAGTWIWSNLFTTFFAGIALAVLGPIVLRLVYEILMMFILLVKNVIDINNKLKAPKEENNTEE